MRVLITGGNGFIGTNLCNYLIKKGHTVKSLDIARTNLLPDCECIKGSIHSLTQCMAACRGMDAVVHLAAESGVRPSIENPTNSLRTNVLGTFNILQAAKSCMVDKVIFASSGGAILGDAPVPFTEVQHCVPLSPYGASKLCGEAYLSAFAASYGLSCTALRFSNVYGPFSRHKQNLIPNFFKCAQKDDTFIVNGDGKQTRDFIYVGDLIKGIRKALTFDKDGFHIFNLSTMVETTVNDTISLMQDIVKIRNKKTVSIKKKKSVEGEVRYNYASNKKAANDLNFFPTYTLMEGLTKTAEWFLKI